MKILEINKFYYIKGGSERHYFDVINLLKKEAYEVIPFSMKNEKNVNSDHDKYFIDNIDYSKFSLKNIINIFWNFEATRKLKKLIKEEKPDVAHLHNIAHQISPAIIKALKKNNIPVIQTLHDYKIVCPAYTAFRNGQACMKCKGGKYLNCVKNKCHKNSFSKSLLMTLESYLHNRIFKAYDIIDYFIAPSEYLKNTHVKFGIPAEKIIVLNNFISEDNLPKNISSKEKEDDYFLYFGRLSNEKGIGLLVDVFRDLDDNYKLKLVGDGPMRDELKRQIEKENLQEKIELLGYKKGDELINLIQNAKAVLLPSICLENMPYSMLEAMYLGKVLIASETGGIPEIIKDGENGFLFRMGSKQDLIQRIKSLDSYDLVKISKRAKETVNKLNSKNYYIGFSKIINRIKKQ